MSDGGVDDLMLRFTASTVAGQNLPIYIEGAWKPARSGQTIASYDPTTGSPWYQAADAGAGDVDDAVNAAGRAFADANWRGLTQTRRAGLMFALADLISRHAEELARLETRDNGKLFRETHAQIGYLADYYRYFAGIADKIQGDTIPVNKPQMLNFTVREPLGVVGIIVPWNSPLNTMSVTVAPCLAVGNTVVVKPSEHTSASAIAFAELVAEAGFPDGVYNVVSGCGRTAGEALARHPGISKIAFTGSTQTGRAIAQSAASHLAQANLELGGKSPHVVFEDADLGRAANGVVAGVFAAAGQTCVAGSRCFVHASVHDEMIDRLETLTGQIRVGDPMADDTQVGPLALRAQLEKVEQYVGYGTEDGARLVTGGCRPDDAGLEGGWYYRPTLFAGVSNDMRIARDEIFGPVAGVIKFSDEDDLLAQANDTDYGLAAGIWTRDVDRAMRFAHAVDAGTVWINTYRSAAMMSPMGGFKDSGYGKHNGFEAVRDYSRLKNVVLDYSGSAQDAFVIRLK